MTRRYIFWRNNHAYDERLRRIVDRANQLDAALAITEFRLAAALTRNIPERTADAARRRVRRARDRS